MNGWKAAALLAALCITAPGCATKTGTSEQPAAAGDTSMTSLDWWGTYSGVVPCADCEGIETSITLNQDRTYVVRTRYLGRDAQVFERRGTFTWSAAGNAIQLSDVTAGPDRYLVGENVLIQLDMAGNRITGDLAAKYVLAKGSGAVAGTAPPAPAAPAAPAALFAPSWQLVEIMGQPVPPPAAGGRAPSIAFEPDGTMHGFAGCNNFTGAYEYEAGNRLRFSQTAATMKACADMSIETEFLKVLGQVDNCYVDAEKLALHKGRMAPLARFVAVKE